MLTISAMPIPPIINLKFQKNLSTHLKENIEATLERN